MFVNQYLSYSVRPSVSSRKLLQISFFWAAYMDSILSSRKGQWFFFFQSEGFLALQIKRGAFVREKVSFSELRESDRRYFNNFVEIENTLLSKFSANNLFRAPLVLNCCTPALQLFSQFRTLVGLMEDRAALCPFWSSNS